MTTEDMADPALVAEQVGTSSSFAYHLYGGGDLVKHMKSIDDLSNWSPATTVLARPAKWCSNGNGQAPSVVQRVDGKWLLFSAGSVAGATQQLNKCIGVAVGERPEGPFEPVGDKPLVCQLELSGSIDPSARLLKTTNGTGLYLYWKTNDAVKGGATGAGLWGQRLADDGLSLLGEPALLVVAGPHGENSSWNLGTVENPAMYQSKRGDDGTPGPLRLFYSGSAWPSSSYAIGYAHCSSPLGPCVDACKQRPWLASYNETAGPGGAEIFTDPMVGWKPWVVFHGWQKGKAGYDHGGTRRPRAYPIDQLPPLPLPLPLLPRAQGSAPPPAPPTPPTAATTTAATAALPHPYLLFVDRRHMNESSTDARLTLRMQQPVEGPWVLVPDRPWEAWAISAYNSILAGNATRPHRLYYDCVEDKSAPRRVCVAESQDGIAWSKPALGLYNWSGSIENNIVVAAEGCSVFVDPPRPGTPVVPESERFKMVCSNAAHPLFASADGLEWRALPCKALSSSDDTQPTAQWDSALGKYVIYVRRNIGAHDSGSRRHVGRCITANLSDWESEVVPAGSGCPVVFGADKRDPPNLDIYTSAHLPYPSADQPAAHLFFPSVYHHFPGNDTHVGPPNGRSNDGLLDTRMLVAPADLPADELSPSLLPAATPMAVPMANLSYAADGSRAPFVSLGINRCGASRSTPSQSGGWCSPTDGVSLRHTSIDTSGTWMAPGYIPSPDGEQLHLYRAGQPYTHGGAGEPSHSWGNHTAIGILTLRRDGFVALEAPYAFDRPLPSFATTTLRVPDDCPPPANHTTREFKTSCAYKFPDNKCPRDMPAARCNSHADCLAQISGPTATCHAQDATVCRAGVCTAGFEGGELCSSWTTRTSISGGVQLQVNFITSVAGFVAIAVEAADDEPPPANAYFDLEHASRLKGNAIAAVPSWSWDGSDGDSGGGGGGRVASLAQWAGRAVRLRVEMADARLFSLRMVCAAGSSAG